MGINNSYDRFLRQQERLDRASRLPNGTENLGLGPFENSTYQYALDMAQAGEDARERALGVAGLSKNDIASPLERLDEFKEIQEALAGGHLLDVRAAARLAGAMDRGFLGENTVQAKHFGLESISDLIQPRHLEYGSVFESIRALENPDETLARTAAMIGRRPHEIMAVIDRHEELFPEAYRQFKDLAASLGRDSLWEEVRFSENGDIILADEEFDRSTFLSWFENFQVWDIRSAEFWTVAVQSFLWVRKTFGNAAAQIFYSVIASLIVLQCTTENEPSPQPKLQYNEIIKGSIRCVTRNYPERDFTDWRIVTAKDGLNIREGAGMNEPLLGALPHAEWVRFIEKSEDLSWSLIEYRNPYTKDLGYGWVFSRHLRKINAPAPKRKMAVIDCTA